MDALGILGSVMVSFFLSSCTQAPSSPNSLASIYRVPLQAPATMERDIKSNALALEPLLTDVVIKHPLVSQTTAFSYVALIHSISLPLSFPHFVQQLPQSSLFRRNPNLRTSRQCKLI
jgi:hypothetical protein